MVATICDYCGEAVEVPAGAVVQVIEEGHRAACQIYADDQLAHACR